MSNIEISIGQDGVAIATFDAQNRSMNTITLAVQAELGMVADRVRSDPDIKGLVIRSGKATGFCAGADLSEMAGAIAGWRAAADQPSLRAGVESAGNYSRQVRALETCGKPVATVVHGVALGGGLELALAGHRRIATGDQARLRLGLPEATIGLMPGAGGTQRLPRIMGIATALAHLIDGVPIVLETALRSGIVHEHIEDPGAALEAARSWVLANPGSQQPWDVKGYRLPEGPHSPVGYTVFASTVAAVRGDGPNDHAARANILRAIYEGAQVPIDAGLRIETRYFFNTVRAVSSSAMMRTLFTTRQALAKTERSDPAPYLQRLGAAWQESAERLVAEGCSASLVRGVAQALSSKFPGPGMAVDRALSVELPNPLEVRSIETELLWAAAHAAEAALADGLVRTPEEGDLAALEGGYPAWTGGPFSYLAAQGQA